MSTREAILARLRHTGCRAPTAAPEARAELVPAMPLSTRIRRFTQLAHATQMSVACVDVAREIPLAVRACLGDQAGQRPVVVDTFLPITAEDWLTAGITTRGADTSPDGDVYIRAGYAAIAECGAVLIASGAGRALRNDFLAHTHIVIVPIARLLSNFSDLWALLRAQRSTGGLPREICLVTGPSRTADLGVPAKLGAHGPARVHVILSGAADP